MTVTYVTTTSLLIVDSTAVIRESNTKVVVMHVTYVPSIIGDDLVIQNAIGKDAIVLKAGGDSASVQMPFGPEGRKIDGLKVSTIDGGTAYIYLAKK